MHNYIIPQPVKDRVIKRQGKLLSHDTIDAARTALVVVDMQNYFVAEGFAAEVPAARDIVPNINRMAKALRAAGGTVLWVQTTAAGALEHWANHHKHMLTADRVDKRLTQLNESHDGFKVYPKLEALPTDLRVKKIKYSAFIPGSSDIDAQLKSRGIDTLLITGTVTNVCCESTARDAMMLDYRVIMVSDGNASLTDEEHAASLNNFLVFFGDVMTTDEAATRLMPAERRKTA
ncbi:isochorismatase family protein [Rhodoplanes sp. Z2-YC6860]|uniref:isochorismatase family protein n=1 Tax=Rhodoplanes sp. Z2-YC6860 TaxID=674703 RepID=UPI00078CF9A5|nr:cysteine hydrolase [Rhodoplanes sp. Z2-YC6860]AMN40758.1 isochorismatase transposase [Rhodoplanes sp. Z2-YC6860]